MIHFVTVVGSYARLLPQLLSHYRQLGATAFHVFLHIQPGEPSPRDEVEQITRDFGCGIAGIYTGPWYENVNRRLIRLRMGRYPNDWFFIADQDEFQVYPGDVEEILSEAAARDEHYLDGGLLDRIADGGVIAPLDRGGDIWQQYPWCGFLTLPLLNGDPRKVVLARGSVELDAGQHRQVSPWARRHERHFVAVHHFKWVDDVIFRLKRRAKLQRFLRQPVWKESATVARYFKRSRGLIDLNDPRFYFVRTAQDYPHLDLVRSICRSYSRAGDLPALRESTVCSARLDQQSEEK